MFSVFFITSVAKISRPGLLFCRSLAWDIEILAGIRKLENNQGYYICINASHCLDSTTKHSRERYWRMSLVGVLGIETGGSGKARKLTP